jgi:predicted enzyme related to lactoylglutathione lyase
MAEIADQISSDAGTHRGDATSSSLPPEPMRQGDIGYVSLWVPDLQRAVAFYGDVLGWTFGPGSVEQGRQVGDVWPAHGVWGGQERGTLFLCFVVDDVSAAMQRIVAAGGEAGEPSQEGYGVIANCRDDQGMPFAVYHPAFPSLATRRPARGERAGDVAYITVETPDSAKARAFFGAVLGWSFSAGRAADGWQVAGTAPMVGMGGGREAATVLPMYRVDDIVAAVARVRAAGGTSTDPERQPYGLQAYCRDDQGTRFYLGQL